MDNEESPDATVCYCPASMLEPGDVLVHEDGVGERIVELERDEYGAVCLHYDVDDPDGESIGVFDESALVRLQIR